MSYTSVSNRRLRACSATAIAAFVASVSAAADAQNFPVKPLRIIVRAAPGGADDLVARLVAQPMGNVLGQQMIVDYRAGAGGLVAWEYVAKSPPDGYTVLLAASGLAAIRSLRPDMPVDPWKDFTWVSQVASFMLVLGVHPALPVKTLKDLIALARSRPGQLSYGSSGVGATPHLAAEYFISMAKIDIKHVPYKGSTPMYVDLMGGRIEMGTAVLGSALPHIKSGKLRGLGVSGAKRSPQVPEVPTIAEGGGLPGYEFQPFYALVVAANTPKEVVSTLAGAVAKVMSSQEFRDNFTRISGIDPAHNTPEQMLQVAKKEAALVDKIVRTSGIKGE